MCIRELIAGWSQPADGHQQPSIVFPDLIWTWYT